MSPNSLSSDMNKISLAKDRNEHVATSSSLEVPKRQARGGGFRGTLNTTEFGPLPSSQPPLNPFADSIFFHSPTI